MTLQNSAESIDTRSELAAAAGVSHDTIAKAKVIAEKASPETIERLRSGEGSIHSAYTALTKTAHVFQNSGENEWYSPKPYIDIAHEVMEGRITPSDPSGAAPAEVDSANSSARPPA